MAVNDFLEFNEAKNDIQTNEEYQADRMRQDGLQTGLAPTKLHNKMFRQFSVMASAIGEVIKNRGFNAKDATKAELVNVIDSAFPKVPALYCRVLRDFEGRPLISDNIIFETSKQVTLNDTNEILYEQFTAQNESFYGWVSTPSVPTRTPVVRISVNNVTVITDKGVGINSFVADLMLKKGDNVTIHVRTSSPVTILKGLTIKSEKLIDV